MEALGESVLNGTDVDFWMDKSGNDIAATATAIKPTVVMGGYNGYPTVSFAQNILNHFVTGNIPRSADETIFCVSTISDAGNRSVYDAGTGDLRRLYANAGGGDNHMVMLGTGGSLANNVIPYTTTMISKAVFGTGAGNSLLQLNQNSPAVTGDASGIPNNTSFYIGNVGSGATASVNNLYGDISEIIVYAGTVNSAQSIIIHNYLSAKYNIDLLDLDLYTQDLPINGDYDHGVAGIGRVDASNIHPAAQGTSIVMINNPDNLGDGEFLLWGHDAGVQEATNTIDVPAGVLARLDRVWRVSEVNMAGGAVDVGGIDMSFDLSGMGPVVASDLRLLIDTDNDGVFAGETPISGASAVGGDVYLFAGVTALADGLRFTLGTIDPNTTGLPIGLAYFHAKVLDEQVHLNWRTVSEVNNAYFTVERSVSGLYWEWVDEVDGAQNSQGVVVYTSLDEAPYPGLSFYRLKQTDRDGQSWYSETKEVHLDGLGKAVTAYPNPTPGPITMVGAPAELEGGIRIYSLYGQDLGSLEAIPQKNPNEVWIDLSYLPSGTYMLKTKSTAIKVNRQ